MPAIWTKFQPRSPNSSHLFQHPKLGLAAPYQYGPPRPDYQKQTTTDINRATGVLRKPPRTNTIKALSTHASEIITKQPILLNRPIWLQGATWSLRSFWCTIIAVGIKVWNQSQSSDFRIKAAVTKGNTIEARHPGDELPYICQYKGNKRFQHQQLYWISAALPT